MLKKIKPIHVEKIWGYEKWIYSSYPGKETLFENGKMVKKGPLVKIIKTNQPLSIQVHPDNKMAKEIEFQENGKSESWYILEAKEDSELILGMKNYDKNYIKNEVNKETFINNMNIIKAEKDKFYNVPAGLVHGLGANITVLEVQQCSDITYRYYDYNRKENNQLRELHVNKALLAQKDITYKIKPLNKENNIYDTKYATQQFCRNKANVEKNSLIIDLITHEAFWVKENTKINMKKFAIIKW